MLILEKTYVYISFYSYNKIPLTSEISGITLIHNVMRNIFQVIFLNIHTSKKDIIFCFLVIVAADIVYNIFTVWICF